MSEKKVKGQINIPLYDIKEQANFIISICDDLSFEYDKLIPLILADWIYTFQLATSKSDYRKAFLTYLDSATLTADKLKKLKKDLENERQKNNDCSC